jgi:serine/alanine adding enzyme
MTGRGGRMSPDRVDTALEPDAPDTNIHVVHPDRWNRLLADLQALETYTCHAYHRASALLEPPGTQPVLLHAGDDGGEIALPLLLRPLPDRTGWDATSAYGYGGPVAHGHPDLAAFGRALTAWGRENAVVTTFLRLNPLQGNRRLLPPGTEVLSAGQTVVWDVAPRRDRLRSMHPDHRRSVRKAERAGLQVTVEHRPPNLDQFQELYDTTMRRLGATDFYQFPRQYWDELLADDDVLTPVLVEGRLEGRLVAVLLCLASHEWLHAHLSATADAARSIGASTSCYLAAAEWAQQRGLRGVHLGGALGGGAASALFGFKHRFDPSSDPREFEIAKIVHDPVRYRELAGTDSTAGFFPPWRRPE